MGMSLEAWLPAKLPGQAGLWWAAQGQKSVEAASSKGDRALGFQLAQACRGGWGGLPGGGVASSQSPLKPMFLLGAP